MRGKKAKMIRRAVREEVANGTIHPLDAKRMYRVLKRLYNRKENYGQKFE